MTLPTNRRNPYANGGSNAAYTPPGMPAQAPAAANWSSNGTANRNDASGGYKDTLTTIANNAAAAKPKAPPPTPFAGLQPGTSFMTGVDMTKPGAAENFYQQNQAKWTAPTMASQFYNANSGALGTQGAAETYGQGAVDKYGSGNNPQVTNNAQSNYNAFEAGKPTIGTDPGFGSYYENAGRQATEGIDKAMAAQGTYGSSARNDQVSEALTNLAADRAKNEAGYNLNRLGEQRAWETEGGNLAGQADTVSNMGSANNLSWLQGLGQIAGQGEGMGLARMGLGGSMASAADSGSLNYLNSGMNAAGQAQMAQTNRGQNAFENQMQYGGALSGLMGDAYNGMFNDDKSLLDAQLGMGTAGAAERQDQAKYATDQSRKSTADTVALMDMLRKYGSAA